MLKHFTDSERVKIDKPGFAGMSAYFCLTKKEDCPNFALRVMEFEPDGHTSYHAHLEEHEMYFIEGKASYVDDNEQEHHVKPGDTLYIPAKAKHQIKNAGKTIMRMVCVVPILPGKDGRSTTKV